MHLDSTTSAVQAVRDQAIRQFRAGEAGDFDTVLAEYAPDIVWTNGPAAGPWVGRFDGVAAVATMFGEFMEFFEGTFTQELVDVCASADHAVLVLHEQGTRGRHRFDNVAAWLFRVRDGLVAEVWTLDLVPGAADAFWDATRSG